MTISGMQTIRNTLARLEARLQAIIEGSVARLLTANEAQSNFANRLIEAMQEGTRQSKDGQTILPNLFILVTHPEQAQVLRENTNIIDEMIRTLQDEVNHSSLTFLSPPEFRVLEDIALPLGQTEVVAQVNQENLAQTTDMGEEYIPAESNLPQSAFLIVNGVHTFPITQSVINIGRHPDNHLVIDDPRISRLHAQLRLVRGRYVIFDLDSTGGTYINDQRIHQSFLFPGDVISLAGVPLVFGQDTPGLVKTQQYTVPCQDKNT